MYASMSARSLSNGPARGLDHAADGAFGLAESLVDHGAVQIVLAGEVVEQRCLLDADARRDLVQAGAVVAVLAERRLSLDQDAFARPVLACRTHTGQSTERSDGNYDIGQLVG